ncbi:MAG: alkyl hydroperoxide reductase [Paenibacillaceae bacterium]|jgi:peroxiredoxin|nr:alkyl hydroperoxide reductase [Paenibacillaceae bacterium]
MSQHLQTGIPFKAGDKALDFDFVTPWKGTRNFYEVTEGKTNVVFFLRYFGCTACQLKIKHLINDYPKFRDSEAEVFVVLQSEPETLREEATEEQIPFEIILDPEQVQYRRYHIGDRDPDRPRSPKAILKAEEARSLGLIHGKYEGNEQQLPATFIIDGEHNIIWAHYGLDGSDTPETDELLSILKIGRRGE